MCVGWLILHALSSGHPHQPATTTYGRRLGEIGFSCIWAATVDGPNQLVPCTGIISLASSPKVAAKGRPLSTATFAFWVAAGSLPATITSAQLVSPIATRTTGSWGKNPETIQGFGWAVDPTTGQLFLTVDYWKSAWNPVSLK